MGFEGEYGARDGGEFSADDWNEADWRRYLTQIDVETTLFLKKFVQLRQIINHLDLIALQMGWTQQEDNSIEAILQKRWREGPQTLHKHPVYIVTHGLYHFLYKNWELYQECSGDQNLQMSWVYARLLGSGEHDALLGIACMDADDPVLAICHFKSALQSINYSMGLIQKAPGNSEKAKLLLQDAILACFDLREVWLRVMTNCRDIEKDDENDEDEE
ncbi:MAG: hypothetical protein LBT57_00545 [Puniceicoccales bacterium]|jgi:hypothetical protein|nr:hypothetical protein [Puniceicoccales bacterium]